MACCPSKTEAVQKKAKELALEEENLVVARAAAEVERSGYGKLTRLEEIMLFAKKAGYRKLGLVFCLGLKQEALIVHKVLTHNGFEVSSVICKNGAVPKGSLGEYTEDCIEGIPGIMCNPIGQALLMNEEQTELNILLGLCVGHDALASKYLQAPTTVLAVKDRVLAHNPLAAVYMSEGYYKNKLFP